MSEERKVKSGRKKAVLSSIAAAAAVFVLCIGGYNLFLNQAALAVDSMIMLDVNPSLSLYVDTKETVQKVEALNDDAGEVLGTMDLKGTSLEVAVNAIIGSMLQKGYLGDLQNSILVSVEDPDSARGESLQQKVSQIISDAMKNDSLDAAVLTQAVSADDAALAELARKYSISLGKAALIQEVIAQAPSLTFEDLAPMTINEIALIAASKNVSSESVTQNGAASAKAYISQDEALNLACAHAGVAVEDVVAMDVEFDSEHGVMIYEVEFETAAKDFEYEIDAGTGEVLTYQAKDRKSTGSGASGYIGAAAAKEAALAHAGVAAGDVLDSKVELDSDDGVMIYDVEFETSTKKYEYEINAGTGDVLAYESKDQKSSASGSAQTGSSGSGTSAGSGSGTSGGSGSYIGETAAKAAALAHAGVAESSTAYIKCYLEYDDGKPESYCVEFKVGQTEYEYEIDLYSGAVLDSETENHGEYSSVSSTAGGASYIGEDAALAAALQQAGVAESSLREQHIELEREGSTMVYEIVFKTNSMEYYYAINAVSGAVLRSSNH